MSPEIPAVLPFNRATRAPRQMEYLAASFFSDRISGDGPFSHRCVEALSAHLRTDRVLLTPSCTSALEMAALLSGVGPGDEVIVPSFTFVSSANAFLLFGAMPVFADVDPVRFNITPESIFEALTPRTKAVVVVHYGGISCDMHRIKQLCDEHGLLLIED
jgi:dTDP-4-amino-4,6-dideoxygalactose transaminase